MEDDQFDEEAQVAAEYVEDVRSTMDNSELSRNMCYFRTPNTDASKRFFKEIQYILHLHCEKGMDIRSIWRLIKYDERLLRRQMKHYFVKWLPKFRAYKEKREKVFANDALLAERIDTYMKSRSGRCTTLKMIKDHLVENSEGLIPKSITLYNIRNIMRERLQYSWRQSNHRAPLCFRPENVGRRKLFLEIRQLLQSQGYNLIYIDEAAF